MLPFFVSSRTFLHSNGACSRALPLLAITIVTRCYRYCYLLPLPLPAFISRGGTRPTRHYSERVNHGHLFCAIKNVFLQHTRTKFRTIMSPIPLTFLLPLTEGYAVKNILTTRSRCSRTVSEHPLKRMRPQASARLPTGVEGWVGLLGPPRTY